MQGRRRPVVAIMDAVSEGRTARRHKKRRTVAGIFGIVLCFLVAIASSAFAEGENPDASLSRPSLEEIEASLEGVGPQPMKIELTNPEAAQALPHDDLTRDEVEELLSSVFGPVLQGTAGVFGDLDVDRFRGDHVAVIAPSNQPGANAEPEEEIQPTLLESALPLRAEEVDGTKSIVDLTLEQREGELQPVNPLVDVGIPTQLGEGIALPEVGVEINLADAPAERSPSTVEGGIALYPNVAENTDFTVVPTPAGLETFTQLRSPDSPHRQTFELTLPSEASLRASDDGGAEVVREGRRMVAVLPPTALDAQGESVPARLEVDGSSIVVTASPDSEAAYPILVDPIYQVYTFGQLGAWGAPDFTGWGVFQTHSAFTAATSDWCSACNDIVYGLELDSVPASGIPLNSRVRWDYRVPHWNHPEGTTSFIDHATFSRVGFDVMAQQNNYAVVDDPFFEYYLWDDSLGFISLGRRLGTEGNLSNPNYPYQLTNVAHNPNVKRASLELVSTQPHSQYRHLYVGDATLELSDTDYPRFDSLTNPSSWVNNTASAPISFLARDNGLGVYGIKLVQPAVGSGSKTIETRSGGCTGAIQAPCPRTWSSETGPALKYDPASMPQGENVFPLDVVDALGRVSSGDPGNPGVQVVKIKADHTAPQLTLSGSLTEQGAVGTMLSSYALKYRATDGTHAAAGALAPFGTQGTGNGQMQRPLGIATDRAGHVWMVDRENNRVVKYDEEGNYLGQFGTKGSGNGQLLSPSNIVRTPAGTLWVTDTGNHRVQEFTSSGQYIQQFGTNGSGGGTQFISPFGIASTSDGMLWVSDAATGRVAQFRETVGAGERFVRNATGNPSNPNGSPEFSSPAGLAVDSQNNLWVVDSGHHRLQEFNSNGAFLMRFGSQGTGAGQLKNPYNVAISSSGNLLVTDAGNNRIQQFRPSGTFVQQLGGQGSGADHFTEPRAIAFGAGNKLFVADAGNHRIARWQNAEFDPQSGAVSVQIKVDGNVVKSDAPGCATRDCEIDNEWLLNSLDYASGQHTVEVIATDGVGLTTSKSMTITTVKDTTKPKFTAASPYFYAPQGWVEQKNYSYSISYSDDGGYGVASMAFKIDGKVVKSLTQNCPSGACGATLSGSVDMASYEGGAHPAELVVTDVAGNVNVAAKTFNVAPNGEVSSKEAASTLAAADVTSEDQVVASTEEVIGAEEREDGNDPGLEKEGDILESTGTPNVSTIGVDPDDGFTIDAADAQLSVEPAAVSGATTPMAVVEGVAATSGNIADDIDMVARPKYNGLTTFQSIRDSSAQETFAWEVQLGEDQSLHQLDPQHVQVKFDEQFVQFIIAAEPAHDALGTAVPTSITISGPTEITLTVEHKKQPFVYPVVAGAGWEGGYVGNLSAMPPPEPIAPAPPPYPNLPRAQYVKFGPPIPLPDGDTDSEGAQASTARRRAYVMPFEFDQCAWDGPGGCWTFDAGLNGRFEYNRKFVWWKESKPHPSCPLDSHTGGMSLTYCNWIGPNHQIYGEGYHISAQVKFVLTGVLGASFTNEEHMTAYLYGSGYGSAHNTDAICNPLSSC